MNPDEAECWIVNLIRNARLDAKIDSKLGHVVMGAQPLSPYQQLIEKIDSLSVKSETLSGLIDRKLKARTDIRWGNQEWILSMHPYPLHLSYVIWGASSTVRKDERLDVNFMNFQKVSKKKNSEYVY
ncbi:hypothetical protein NQ317_018949 [Molorchus minor]|uniref:PCI domain-containing protein n=1 Tax=Molorchus minor TaxID=1323400 RepID=A0ABQ9IQW9_9CUCU|nr:hypothetical protein NQ317_018949 [Molorchus minor]